MDVEGNPNEYFVYYPHEDNTDVTSVEKTWWYMLCQKPEFELEISNSYSGVEKSYAIQAGREIRILVKPNEITDEAAHFMAEDIAKQIENEMEYPGQIKVNVIRETRFTATAK